MVDFEWYRSFIAVYRAGTVTAAANTRFLTQPAISQHIASLESALKQPLFKRTPRKMIPTKRGQELYTSIIPAMDSLEKLSEGLRSTTAEQPVVRLGTPVDYFYEVGMERLKGASFQLRIETGNTKRMIDSLLSRRIDAVIATQQTGNTNIDFRKIDQEDFCLVAPPEITAPIDLKSTRSDLNQMELFLLKQRWISFSEELPIIRRFWHIAFGHRPQIDPVMIVPSLQLIRKAIELKWGISVLPRYLCRQSIQTGRLRILWEPKESIVNEIWIATRKVDRNKAEIRQLIELMQKVCGARR